MQEIGQKSGFVSGIVNGSAADDFVVFYLKDIEVSAMSEMFRYLLIFTGYCNFHVLFSFGLL